MHMTQLELFHLLNAELVPTLVAVLQKRKHDIKPEDQQAMLEAADELAKSFVKDEEEFSDEDKD
jgi:hypothetical protein